MRYIVWVATLLVVGDVIQNGRHIGRHLGFYRTKKLQKKLEIFYAGHVEYDII